MATTDAASWVVPVTLEGSAVRLEPLDESHAEELIGAAHSPETFRHFSRGPEPFTADGMRAFIAYLLGPARTVPYCVVERRADARVGITTYLDIRAEHRGLEIGWTWLAPGSRGGRTNPEMKRLMLAHAFETLGAIRVCLKTDERNLLSQNAIAKLGAQREGALRHTMLMPDGFRRTSVMFSILEDEWPRVRDGLDARLAAMKA